MCASVQYVRTKEGKKMYKIFSMAERRAYKTERSKVKYAINEYKYENHKLNSIPESNILILKIRISIECCFYCILCVYCVYICRDY